MRVDHVQIEAAGARVGDEVPPSPVLKGYPLHLCLNDTSVLIGRNGGGQWIARELRGLYGGLFVSQKDAVRYALFENGHRPEAITMVAGILELDLSIASMPEHTESLDVTLHRRAA